MHAGCSWCTNSQGIEVFQIEKRCLRCSKVHFLASYDYGYVNTHSQQQTHWRCPVPEVMCPPGLVRLDPGADNAEGIMLGGVRPPCLSLWLMTGPIWSSSSVFDGSSQPPCVHVNRTKKVKLFLLLMAEKGQQVWKAGVVRFILSCWGHTVSLLFQPDIVYGIRIISGL